MNDPVNINAPAASGLALNVTTPTKDQGQVLAQYQDAAGAQIQTQFKMELDQNALVSIAVADAEKGIRTRLSDLIRQQKVASESLTQSRTLQSQYLENFTRDALAGDSTNVEALRKALVPFGVALANPAVSPAEYNERSRTVSGYVEFTDKSDRILFSRTYEAPAPASMLSAVESQKKAQKEVERLNQEILGVRSALSNVDALERQARASLAAKMAENSGDLGKQLVEGIRGTVNVDAIIDELRY